MVYASVTQIRTLTGLTTTDISDDELTALGTLSAIQLNRDINVRVQRELITYIDTTRQNKRDGSNTTYYIQNWMKHIADSNNDQTVTTSDIRVYSVASTGIETDLTVSTITPDSGKFVLSSAPSGDVRLFVDYYYANVSEYTPDDLIKLAHAYMVGSWAYRRLSTNKYKSIRVGAISVNYNNLAADMYDNLYKDTIYAINNNFMVGLDQIQVV